MKANLIGLLLICSIITGVSGVYALEMQGIWRGTIYSVGGSSIPSSYVGQEVEIRTYWDSDTLVYHTWDNGINGIAEQGGGDDTLISTVTRSPDDYMYASDVRVEFSNNLDEIIPAYLMDNRTTNFAYQYHYVQTPQTTNDRTQFMIQRDGFYSESWIFDSTGDLLGNMTGTYENIGGNPSSFLFVLWESYEEAPAYVSIKGRVDRQGGGTIANATINLLDINGEYLGFSTTVNENGEYNFDHVPNGDLPEGNHIVEVKTDIDSIDEYYSFLRTPENFILGVNDFDYSLAPGGNISGMVSTETVVSNWDDLVVWVLDDNGDWLTYGQVNPSGNYTTYAVPEGTYYIKFTDKGTQFADEWYGNYPGWKIFSDSDPISVSNNTETSGIDSLLHEAALSKDRYYISRYDINTFHSSGGAGQPVKTSAVGEAEIRRFSDGKVETRDIINSLIVVTPSDSCTDSSPYTESYLSILLNDSDNNGIIEANEWRDPLANIRAGEVCVLGDTPHEGGNYQFQVTLNDGTTFEKSLIGVSPGMALADLPPVTNLIVVWSVEKELGIFWSLPVVYPAEADLEIRVLFFNNGHFLNNQIHITNLPADLTSFALDSVMTAYFDTDKVDQLLIEIITSGNNATETKTSQSYTFDRQAGTIVPGPIVMSLLDVNGDKRTGVEEAIFSLNRLVNP